MNSFQVIICETINPILTEPVSSRRPDFDPVASFVFRNLYQVSVHKKRHNNFTYIYTSFLDVLAVLIVYQSHNLTSGALSADNINASFQFSLRGWACLSGSPCQKQKQNSSYQTYSNKRLVSLLRTRNEALPNRYNSKDPTFATVFKSLRFHRRFEDTYCSNTHKHIKKGLRFQIKIH